MRFPKRTNPHPSETNWLVLLYTAGNNVAVSTFYLPTVPEVGRLWMDYVITEQLDIDYASKTVEFRVTKK